MENHEIGMNNKRRAKSIIAIIVTFNRKKLLRECIEAINKQTLQPKKIIIVDNASTDNSEKYIKTKSNLKSLPMLWIRLKTNEGGAGGFHEGIKAAIAEKVKYLWLMDDDGFPSQSCLEKLYIYANEDSYIGPSVLSKDNPSIFAFPLRIPGTFKIIYSPDQLNFSKHHFVPNLISPFNGVLLPVKVVKRVGLPKKEFFLWGDEAEYTLRVQSAGIHIGMVKNALFYHPSPLKVSTKMLFGLLNFNDPPTRIKLYCMVRNNVFTYKKYKGIAYVFAYIFKVLYFYLIVAKDFTKTNISLKAIKAGLRGNFTNHQNFL